MKLASTPSSTLSGITHTLVPLNLAAGHTLLSFEIQLVPKKEHLEVMLSTMINVLQYVIKVDQHVAFIAKNYQPGGEPFPPTVS
jgi:hypothetical protein